MSAISMFRSLLINLVLIGSVADAQMQMIDTQPKGGSQWKARETRTLAGFDIQPVEEESLTRFGGWTNRQRKATDFFRVEKIGKRWWMIDPDGGRFIFNGIGSVKPNAKYNSKEPFDRLFGSPEVWAEKTLDGFREMGLNGIGGFSDDKVIRSAAKPMPYTVTLNLMSRFGKTLNLTHQASGHMGYEHDCLPVFHPSFEQHCMEECAKRLKAMRDDPWLVGVYSDNELPIAKDLLDRMLALDDSREAFASMKGAAEAFMKGKRKVTDKVRRQFVEHVFETYFRVTTKAIRATLPNHLCLGSRFHRPAVKKSGVWRAAGRWCDVISINYYGVWTPNEKDLENWFRWSGKPCMITEFYAKGADSGMANKSGAGWLVRTQADRGAFYQNFTLALLESKTCVGWHWFKYMDNDPSNPRTDPSNKDSNKGIFNVRYEPYQPLVDAMTELNFRVYPLTLHFDSARR